jgi:3-oxoacyl-[acyl-carrier-protein] synthase II
MNGNPNDEHSAVVVTGIGVVSPIGNGVQKFWPAVLAGISGIDDIRSFDTSGFRTHRGGEVDCLGLTEYLSPDILSQRVGKGSVFAVASTKMAIADAGIDLTTVDPVRIGICCGTTMGECQILEKVDEQFVHSRSDEIEFEGLKYYPPQLIPANVALEIGACGPIHMITTACAAGNYAIGYAADLLCAGVIDVAVAGGVDPLSRVAFTGFNSMLAVSPDMCRPFDLHRRGILLSEGCGMLVLERASSAQERGAPIYAEIAGYGISNDAYHMTSPHPRAQGAINAMRSALREADISPNDVDYISAHGTGTPANDKVETYAIKEVFQKRAFAIPVSSIKSMIGHTMGAASAIEAAVCALAIRYSEIPPTMNYATPDPACDLDYVPNTARKVEVSVALSNAFAFGGNCSALLLRRFAQ